MPTGTAEENQTYNIVNALLINTQKVIWGMGTEPDVT